MFLLFASGVHIYRWFQESVQELRIYHSTLALLCFSVALREFDIDKIGTNAVWLSIELAFAQWRFVDGYGLHIL
jgi:hypothetical protein